jgi:hypothetical protein
LPRHHKQRRSRKRLTRPTTLFSALTCICHQAIQLLLDLRPAGSSVGGTHCACAAGGCGGSGGCGPGLLASGRPRSKLRLLLGQLLRLRQGLGGEGAVAAGPAGSCQLGFELLNLQLKRRHQAAARICGAGAGTGGAA